MIRWMPYWPMGGWWTKEDKMILVYAILVDGCRVLLLRTTDINFDVKRWAQSRTKAFKLLRIARIEYEIVEC